MIPLLPSKHAGMRGIISFLLFALTLLITFFAYNYAKNSEDHRIKQEFNQLAHTKAHLVFSRVEGYERVLLDLRGLFIANRHVTENQFINYLDGIGVGERFPALYRIGYAPLVTEDNKLFIEHEIRKIGHPDFQLADAIENRAVILYGYPSTGEALGMILDADPVRNEAIRLARDTGKPYITSAVKLRFDQEHKYGFLIYVPVYKNRISPALLKEKRENIVGYIYAAFRAEDLIAFTISQDLDRYMNLELYDGKDITLAKQFFTSDQFFPSSRGVNEDFITSNQQLHVLGKWWTFSFKTKPRFIEEHQSFLPAVVAIGGCIISFLVAWLSSVIIDYIQSERKVRYLAFYDGLTGLPNRTNLCDTANKTILYDQPTKKLVAVLIIELTGFRQINYTLGHPIGDELLKKVSLRLKEEFKDHGFISRLGNVQFGAILSDCSQNDVLSKAERTIQEILQPFTVGGISYEMGVHIGIAFYPSHGDNARSLLQHADIALNQARIAGRGYVVYDVSQDPYKPQRLALVGDFRNAVADNQLLLYFQPKVNLQTAKITSVEALLRWQHPNYGFIPPDQFIPLIEPTALIHPLTMYVLEEAIKQGYEWSRQNIHIPIAVNLSARNLTDARLPERLDKAVSAWGGQASWIEFEITESSLMTDPAEALRVLNQIHSMGYRIAIDDFGTGYAGLNYLMKLPVDVIKIDRGFTMYMTEDEDAAAIVKSTIEMAHTMGKKVIAEGTANEAIWKALVSMNCDEAQGQYISHALPISDFEEWLKNTRWR